MIDREHMRRHMNDVERIQRVASDNEVVATKSQSYMAWSDYSDSSAASWLILPESDEDLWNQVGSRLTEIVEEDA